MADKNSKSKNQIVPAIGVVIVAIVIIFLIYGSGLLSNLGLPSGQTFFSGGNCSVENLPDNKL